MKSNALVISYLLEAGWELHLSSDADISPAIWKKNISGNEMCGECLIVSANDVIDLHQMDCLQIAYCIFLNNETRTVFRWKGKSPPN